MNAVVLVERCCRHFAGVVFVGDHDDAHYWALGHEHEFPNNYLLLVVPVEHDPSKWKDVEEIEGVTVNGRTVQRWEY